MQETRDAGLMHGLGRSPGVGNGNLLQYSCLENSMDRGAWQTTGHGTSKSQTWLKDKKAHILSDHNILKYLIIWKELVSFATPCTLFSVYVKTLFWEGIPKLHTTAKVLIRHSEKFVFHSRGKERRLWFQQGVHWVLFSFLKITLGPLLKEMACSCQGHAERKREGTALTDHCSGQSRGS